MRQFSTEFPIKKQVSRPLFISQIFAWLRGTTYSGVFEKESAIDEYGNSAFIVSESGEELRILEGQDDGKIADIGFRHDYADEYNRLWRTEGTITRSKEQADQDVFRIRTQCIAKKAGSIVDSPRKPYIIKLILQDDWGEKDGIFKTQDTPHFLRGNSECINSAAKIVDGTATFFLPILYVSSVDKHKWSLNQKELEKLAFDLGGIAHVVVEPDRTFSNNLRYKTSAQNVYNGAIGISIPGQGQVRRILATSIQRERVAFKIAVRDELVNLRTQMPSVGLEWSELQEQQLRRYRLSERSRLSSDEIEKLYNNEIDTLKEQIQRLKYENAQIANHTTKNDSEFDEYTRVIKRAFGNEIYQGEFLDRIRLLARIVIAESERLGLDRRTLALCNRLENNIDPTPELRELLDELARACKDGRSISRAVPDLLSRHGYRIKSERNHITLEALDEYDGLENITVPKTPSEIKGLTNQRTQIERTLGLTRLKK